MIDAPIATSQFSDMILLVIPKRIVSMEKEPMNPDHTSSHTEIANGNIFMMCERLDRSALNDLSNEYHVRFCRKDELDLWMAMPFDSEGEWERNREDMLIFFDSVYAPKGELFFNTCLFVCDGDDRPVATGFLWKAYEEFTTLHWLKVIKSHEGRGIGRALLSLILGRLENSGFPVFLHTQPSSYRAIKLYTDFGFAMLTNPVIGTRENDIAICMPELEKHMTGKAFQNLATASAPERFLRIIAGEKSPEF